MANSSSSSPQSLYFALIFLSVSLVTWAAQPPGRPRLLIPPAGRFYTLEIILATYIQFFAPTFGLCHAFLCLYYPNLLLSNLFDAHSMARLNPSLFTFSKTSLICCALVIFGCSVRRLAMSQLGKSFTWELH